MQTLSASPCARPGEMERMEKKESELEEKREKDEKVGEREKDLKLNRRTWWLLQCRCDKVTATATK